MQAPGTDANHDLGQTLCCLCNQTKHTHTLLPVHRHQKTCAQKSPPCSLISQWQKVYCWVQRSSCRNTVMALDSLQGFLFQLCCVAWPFPPSVLMTRKNVADTSQSFVSVSLCSVQGSSRPCYKFLYFFESNFSLLFAAWAGLDEVRRAGSIHLLQ